jgi:DNA ligase (NAD+)
LNFQLRLTEIITASEAQTTRLLDHKVIVFTGKMHSGTRNEMKETAKKLGAKIGSTLSGKTDWLVVGENVGETKLQAAKTHNTRIIREKEYLKLIET